MSGAPYDVWSLVASFLPDEDVETLCGVNRQLRALGLDARFKDVRIEKHDSKMKRLCEMLSHDEVAARVRKLTIRPWLVQPETRTHASRSENLWNRANTLLNPKYMEQEAEKRIKKRITRDIKRVTSTVQRLKNVEDYQILYDERSTKYHCQLFEAFLSPNLEAFGPNLQRLTIKVPFHFLERLSYVRLPQLWHFDIHLCTGDAPMEEVKYALDGFFVFVHNLRALEHLGISATSSSRNLDLSYFSKRWGTFSHLKSFSLSIPFNGGLLSSPEDLHRHVVEPHAGSLEKLKLSATCCALAPRGLLPHDCHFWIQRILKSSFNTPFLRLREVELALRPLKAELTDLHAFLKLHSVTLERVCLTDRALTLNELAELFDSLESSPNRENYILDTLAIRVDVLSTNLLVLIAQRFPRLKTLDLDIVDIADDAKGMEQSNIPQVKLASFACTLRQHSTALFSEWKLRAINLIESTPASPWINDLERIFRRYLPVTTEVGKLSSLTLTN